MMKFPFAEPMTPESHPPELLASRLRATAIVILISIAACLKWIAVVGCALLMVGCATRPKEYKPPNDAKVKAATVDLNVKVDRARETAKKAKAATEEAAASAKRLIALAGDTKSKLAILRQKSPPELIPLVDAVIVAAEAQEKEEEVTRETSSRAVGWNAQLEFQLGDAERARVTLTAAQDEYAGAAASLAIDATTERNYRIKAEKQLFQQKVFGWLWKIGGGLVVIVIIGLVVLWFTGKLAFKFAK